MNNIQSIIFNKKNYTLKQSQEWIKKHGYKLTFYGKPVDITENYYRYRQQSPKKWKTYRNKIDDGLYIVLGY